MYRLFQGEGDLKPANGTAHSQKYEVCLKKLQGYLAVTELKEECLVQHQLIHPPKGG